MEPKLSEKFSSTFFRVMFKCKRSDVGGFCVSRDFLSASIDVKGKTAKSRCKNRVFNGSHFRSVIVALI